MRIRIGLLNKNAQGECRMKNIEKYPNTKDALEAYNSLGDKRVTFAEWLECEYATTLLETATEMVCAWKEFKSGYRDPARVSNSAGRLSEAIEREKSKPVRNCDVGTPEEQAERYEKLCDSHTCGSRCSGSGCPLYDYDCSPFVWAQMPYEEGGSK